MGEHTQTNATFPENDRGVTDARDADRRREISDKTTIPIGFALAIIAIGVSVYGTYMTTRAGLDARLTKTEADVGALQSQSKHQFQLIADQNRIDDIRLSNVLAKLSLDLVRLTRFAEDWKPPSDDQVKKGADLVSQIVSLATNLPITK